MKNKRTITTTAKAVKATDLDLVKANPEYKHEAGKALARLGVSRLLDNEYKKLVVTL